MCLMANSNEMLTSVFTKLDKSKAGTITSICNIISAVLTPFIGLLIDKVGARLQFNLFFTS